jgi:ribonuclease HIII
MGILIGMDEAGYGPNLGPLVVAATAWRVDDASATNSPPYGEPALAGGQTGAAVANGRAQSATALLKPPRPRTLRKPQIAEHLDLYRILRNIVAKSPSERRVPIADSKALYNPATGLRQLERGLHAVLLTLNPRLDRWSAVVEYCNADPDGHHRRACWPDGFDCKVPVHACPEELTRLGTRFSRACGAAGVEPLAVRARLVFPAEFNELVERLGNKATALSHITIGLLREVADTVCPQTSQSPTPQPSTHIVCDKHGGRNFYTALLQHHFSEHWIAPVFESHSESRYEWGTEESRTRVTFRINGEAFLPTALASMTAKYLRELAMRAFNEFWQSHIPNLRPTAGYSGDSRRFKKDIETKQRELKIDDHDIWRTK